MVTTLALIVGLVIVNILQPGAGMNVDAKAIDTKSIQIYTTKAGQQGTVEFFLNIIPATVVGAFAEGEILQVLCLRHLVRICALFAWERGKPLLNLIVFGVVGIIMRVAPLGAFGAMAFPHGLSRGIWQATKASLRGRFKRALL